MPELTLGHPSESWGPALQETSWIPAFVGITLGKVGAGTAIFLEKEQNTNYIAADGG